MGHLGLAALRANASRGTVIVQALARLVRDLDLEVFFLGTATSWRSYTLDQPCRPSRAPPLGTISQPD